MRSFISRYQWLLLALAVIMLLFVSSSMTYQEQSSIPWLQKYLANQPLAHRLSTINFTYAGKEISIQHLGYFKFVEFFIRKGAHFGTYMLIGIFFTMGLRPFVQPAGMRLVLTLLSITGLAAFDEFHQLLTGGRTPLFQDVMLDTAGAFVGIVLTSLLVALFGRRPKKRRR